MTELHGTYTDALGSTPIAIANNGEVLSTRIREVDFSGYSFDALAPAPGADAAALAGFVLLEGSLSQCLLEIDIPIGLRTDGAQLAGILRARIDMRGGPAAALQLQLTAEGLEARSLGATGYFEDALPQLKQQLPADVWPVNCFFCQFGDLNPYGAGLLGSMNCYRKLKAEYLAAQDKLDVVNLIERSDYTQEIWSCAEYAPRTRAVGYRGGI
jgi:hypothetical protein